MNEKFREALRRLGYSALKINDLEIRAIDLSLQRGISEERARAYI